jgi:hypothetical protein
MDAHGTPLHVVKAGLDAKAKTLIEHEAALLKSQSAERLHAPHLRGTLNEQTVSALSISYAAGQPPRAATDSKLGEILTGWLNGESRIRFSTLPHAQRLFASKTLASNERQILARLEAHAMASAIHHGDFAPWNIREASSGRWTVLDWERGEPQGPPAWDWFHFRVQTAVLVERWQPEAVLNHLDSCLRQPDFQRYSQAANIAGLEHELLLGYLLHARDVMRQTEGAEIIEALAARLTARLKGS